MIISAQRYVIAPRGTTPISRLSDLEVVWEIYLAIPLRET